MKILVVDDEDLLVKGIRFNLQNEGYEVYTGSNGLDAISLTQSKKPDLIIFSSMYHGGIVQQEWAYNCRAYFAGAICGCQSRILNPFGEECATSTNYQDYITGRINLDYALAHIDRNRASGKFRTVSRHYSFFVYLFNGNFRHKYSPKNISIKIV